MIRVRRRPAPTELEIAVGALREIRDASLEIDEQHRASCPARDHGELLIQFTGPSLDSLIATLERALVVQRRATRLLPALLAVAALLTAIHLWLLLRSGW